MIIVQMGLSLDWQNGHQNRSLLTTLRFNRQLAMSAKPQSHWNKHNYYHPRRIPVNGDYRYLIELKKRNYFLST